MNDAAQYPATAALKAAEQAKTAKANLRAAQVAERDAATETERNAASQARAAAYQIWKDAHNTAVAAYTAAGYTYAPDYTAATA